MVFDLNSQPPDELPSTIHAVLPDLNEGPPDEEQLFQFHEAQFAQLVGSDITGGQNEGISSGNLYNCYEYKNEIDYIHLCLPHYSAC